MSEADRRLADVCTMTDGQKLVKLMSEFGVLLAGCGLRGGDRFGRLPRDQVEVGLRADQRDDRRCHVG
ncbi:hypothetical protein [Streptomyces atratus]|uniref:hypothetical protein n=1 Tax=Streptomyces atratus TaxID=1893 RepID=UPI0018E540D5|nr:hypothetical protein [Streptomyces atratus]